MARPGVVLAYLLAFNVFLVVPAPAHRGMAVADMQCFWPGDHALTKGAGTAQNQVIASQVQVLHRKRVEG
jgi:hypothetical protein